VESSEALTVEAEQVVPNVVHDATHARLWVPDVTDARRIAAELVAGLGGELVPASVGDEASLAVDLSFGDGRPEAVS
jgi:hypothetical protein